MTDTQKPTPKGSNGTGIRVTADSVEKGSNGTTGGGISGSNNRHNGTTNATTPQKTSSTGNSNGNGDSNSKDSSAVKSGKKRRKVNHGSWPYLLLAAVRCKPLGTNSG